LRTRLLSREESRSIPLEKEKKEKKSSLLSAKRICLRPGGDQLRGESGVRLLKDPRKKRETSSCQKKRDSLSSKKRKDESFPEPLLVYIFRRKNSPGRRSISYIRERKRTELRKEKLRRLLTKGKKRKKEEKTPLHDRGKSLSMEGKILRKERPRGCGKREKKESPTIGSSRKRIHRERHLSQNKKGTSEKWL